MRVKEVKLRNFLSHRFTNLSFPLGLTVIVGDNGSGKTSILDGISYALYKVHSRGKDENLISRRSSESWVSVTFSSGGRDYSVEWTISKRARRLAQQATLRDLTDGRAILVDAGEKAVVPEVTKRVGISKEVFENAMYVKQGEITRMLEARPAERKRIITELLGIDDLERAWDALRTPIAKLEERLKSYEREAGREDELKEEIKQKKEELSRNERALKDLKAKIDGLSKEKKKLEEKVRLMESKKKMHEKLMEELHGLEKKIGVKKQELLNAEENLRKISKAEEEIEANELAYGTYESLRKELEELQEGYEKSREMVGKLSGYEDKARALEEDVKELERVLSSMVNDLSYVSNKSVSIASFQEDYEEANLYLSKSVKKVEERISKVGEELSKIEGMVNVHDANLGELSKAEGTCPLCGQSLTPKLKEELVAHLNEEVKKAKENMEMLKAEKAKLEEEGRVLQDRKDRLLSISPQEFSRTLKRLELKKEELNDAKRGVKELSKVREESDDIRKDILKKKEELKRVEEGYKKYVVAKGLVKELGTLDRAKAEVNRIRAEVGEIESKANDVRQELKGLGFDEGEYDKARKGYDGLKEELYELSGNAKQVEERVSGLSREVNRLEEDLKEALEARSMAENVRKEIGLLRVVRECFGKDGVQKILRAQAKQALEAYARGFLQSFNLTYSDLRLDEDYDVYLYGPDGERRVEMLSGGEKVAVALSLRLAVAKALAGDRMELIMMDEPTSHLDTERRRELVRLLTSLKRSSGLLPQAIVVTHDREVEEAADQVYEVVKKEGFSYVEGA